MVRVSGVHLILIFFGVLFGYLLYIIIKHLVYELHVCKMEKNLPLEKKSYECLSYKERCMVDCMKLNLTFWKYDSSGLGSIECWCLKNKTPIQVW